MRPGLFLGAAMLVATPAAAQGNGGPPPEMLAFEKSLHKQTGDVPIREAHATLHLGNRYYFVPAAEAKQVLTKVWGNPPQAADGVLGIVFQQGTTIFDNVWGAVVTYDAKGYVTDDDAKTADYGKVLDDIRSGEATENEERRKGGYPEIHLVGWAQPPSYDARSHALIWARDLKFGGGKVDTLNYDVRLLGRGGVLSLNMLSDMEHLADVRGAAADFGRAVGFDAGSRYADYDPALDKKAGYGLAGLVAAGAGVVAVKKLGFLAIVLGFGKKLIVLVALAGAAILRGFRKLFGRGETGGEA